MGWFSNLTKLPMQQLTGKTPSEDGGIFNRGNLFLQRLTPQAQFRHMWDTTHRDGASWNSGSGIKEATAWQFPGWAGVSEKVTKAKITAERVNAASAESAAFAAALKNMSENTATLTTTTNKNVADVNAGGTASVTVGSENIYRRGYSPVASSGVTIGI